MVADNGRGGQGVTKRAPTLREPTSGDVQRTYDGLAHRYDRMERLINWLVRRRRRQMTTDVRGRVLEVAVGTGANLPFYSPEAQVTGLDLSPAMLAHARAKARRLGRQVELLVGDAETLPFPDATFDTVLSSFSSCTFPDPVRAMSEMTRVCRPGGQVVLLEHTLARNAIIRRVQNWVTPWTVRRVCCHQNRDVLAMAVRAGLDIQRVERALGGYLCLLWARPGVPSPGGEPAA